MNDLNFKDKKVLIMGLGINGGGLGSTKFFAKEGANVRVTDMMNADFLKSSIDELQEFNKIEYFLSGYRFEDFEWADIIIKNPSVKPDDEYIAFAKEKNKQIETDVSIFLQFVDRKNVLGITGTKGKSTTSTLTAHILKKVLGEEKVLLAGNIGKSMLDVIPYVTEDSIVILELSSFQLMIFQQNKLSVHRAAVTNIYPDHLNYHGTMEEYIKAKKSIAAFQNSDDLLFIRKSDEVTTSGPFLEGLKAKIEYSNVEEIIKFIEQTDPRVRKDDNVQNELPEILRSEHNLENFAQASKIAESFGLTHEQIIEAVQDFKGVEFRQQLIKTWNGVKIINDTTATTPNAAIAALKTYPDCILIAGGMDKGLPYEELAQAFDLYPKAIYFIEGSATDKLKELMKEQEKIRGTWNNFEEILEQVKKAAIEGDTVILSPGGTSFNFFKNEFDRGRKFNDSVEKVFS